MTFDEYVAGLSPEYRAEFERIRAIVHEMVPDADETISYGIPTWKHRGKYVLYFSAHRNHMSVHPAFAELIDSVRDQLGDFVLTKGTLSSRGTVQFTPDNPVPAAIIRAIITSRLQAIEQP